GRKAFTIAHGVGHKVCAHPIPVAGDVEQWIRYACGGYTDKDERECDVFASEYVTPEPWVSPLCDMPQFDHAAAHAITRAFPASYVMAANRMVELWPLACAVMDSKSGVIQWGKASRTFPRRVLAGMRVPDGSIACDFFAGRTISDLPRRLLAQAW